MSEQQCTSDAGTGKGARRSRSPLSAGGASTVFLTPSRQLEEEAPTMR